MTFAVLWRACGLGRMLKPCRLSLQQKRTTHSKQKETPHETNSGSHAMETRIMFACDKLMMFALYLLCITPTSSFSFGGELKVCQIPVTCKFGSCCTHLSCTYVAMPNSDLLLFCDTSSLTLPKPVAALHHGLRLRRFT